MAGSESICEKDGLGERKCCLLNRSLELRPQKNVRTFADRSIIYLPAAKQCRHLLRKRMFAGRTWIWLIRHAIARKAMLILFVPHENT